MYAVLPNTAVIRHFFIKEKFCGKVLFWKKPLQGLLGRFCISKRATVPLACQMWSSFVLISNMSHKYFKNQGCIFRKLCE